VQIQEVLDAERVYEDTCVNQVERAFSYCIFSEVVRIGADDDLAKHGGLVYGAVLMSPACGANTSKNRAAASSAVSSMTCANCSVIGGAP
jgi:hypothetical protein